MKAMAYGYKRSIRDNMLAVRGVSGTACRYCAHPGAVERKRCDAHKDRWIQQKKLPETCEGSSTQPFAGFWQFSKLNPAIFVCITSQIFRSTAPRSEAQYHACTSRLAHTASMLRQSVAQLMVGLMSDLDESAQCAISVNRCLDVNFAVGTVHPDLGAFACGCQRRRPCLHDGDHCAAHSR